MISCAKKAPNCTSKSNPKPSTLVLVIFVQEPSVWEPFAHPSMLWSSPIPFTLMTNEPDCIPWHQQPMLFLEWQLVPFFTPRSIVNHCRKKPFENQRVSFGISMHVQTPLFYLLSWRKVSSCCFSSYWVGNDCKILVIFFWHCFQGSFSYWEHGQCLRSESCILRQLLLVMHS